MLMTVDKIVAVKDEIAYKLLIEPLFEIEGMEFQLLNEFELKRKRISNTAGFTQEELVEQRTVLNRNVQAMVTLIKGKIPFRLNNRKDAKFIFTIIDHFLQCQARLVGKRVGGLKDFMVDDFRNLTELANMMLDYIDVNDRIDLMNAPKEPEKKYDSPFDFDLGDLFDLEMEFEDSPEVIDAKGNYQSPFTAIIANSNKNRVRRW